MSWAESLPRAGDHRRGGGADGPLRRPRLDPRRLQQPGGAGARDGGARAASCADVEVTHLLTFGARRLRGRRATPGSFRHRALFTGPNVRQAVNEGRADFVPVTSRRSPGLIALARAPVDVALIHVSPPDEHGFCSFGVGVECTKAAAESARDVIALVNRQMPRSLGDSLHPRLAPHPRGRGRPAGARAAAGDRGGRRGAGDRRATSPS